MTVKPIACPACHTNTNHKQLESGDPNVEWWHCQVCGFVLVFKHIEGNDEPTYHLVRMDGKTDVP